MLHTDASSLTSVFVQRHVANVLVKLLDKASAVLSLIALVINKNGLIIKFAVNNSIKFCSTQIFIIYI